MHRTLFARLASLVLVALVASAARVTASPIITTFAGTATPTGTATNFSVHPANVACDSSGNVYIADVDSNIIFRVDHTTGIMTVVAGTGATGYSGDGGPATSATLNSPSGLAFDSAGNMYIAEALNHCVRKVDTSGNISTIAGTGTSGFSGDGGPATSAKLAIPYGVACNAATGDLYIADSNNNRIRKIDGTSGNISTVAGNGVGGYLGDNVAATSTRLNRPSGVVVDSAGNFYIADTNNNRIRKVDTSGTITTVVGTGSASYGGDSGLATAAKIHQPQSLWRDTTGNLYIADTANQRIRKVNTSGIITTIAGTGAQSYSGDGGPATSAAFNTPQAVTVDGSGSIFVCDKENYRLRKIDTSGNISTFAGTGLPFYGGDGGPASAAEFYFPAGIITDPLGNIYVVDQYGNRVRKIDTSGVITTVAGTGVDGYSGDNGPATSARLSWPGGLALDATGNLYIADVGNNRIRKVDTSGTITTFAGTGTGDFSGDNGPATSAELSAPGAVAVRGTDIYIADSGNNRIRKVDSSGTITTVAGTGEYNYTGDGGAATNATLSSPMGISIDQNGNIFVADSGNYVIREIDTEGTITTIAGTSYGYSGDGGLATAAQLSWPNAVALDTAGNLYITDAFNNCIRKVDTSGIITTVVGNGTCGFSGDGGNPTSAELNNPLSVAVTSSGALYIADAYNFRIRKVADVPAVITSASTASATYRTVFSGFTITASGTVTSFTASGLPPGLSLDTSTGVISGTPTQAGTFNATVYANNSGGASSPATLTITVAKVPLTVTGLTVNDKTYDGTTAATLNTSGATLIGVVSGDNVSLDATAASATFADKHIGAAKSVTVTGLALTGTDIANYSFSQPTGLTATISAKNLSVTGLSATNKTWDGTTTATLTGTPTLSGVLVVDASNVALAGSAVGNFSDSNVGNSKTVSITGLTLTGSAAGDYTLTLPTATGNITTATATVNLSNLTWTYDGAAHGATATTVPSGLTVNVTYAGSATQPTNGGSYSVVATVSDAHYAGSASGTLVINPASQTISFSSSPLTVGTPITLNATATSGLPVTFTLASGNATLSGSSLTANDSSPIVVRASQSGNSNYAAASPVDATFTSGKLSQTITFDAISDKQTTDGSFALNASASSGLPVTFSVTSGPAMVSGSTVTLTGSSGTVTIKASQAGNNVYQAAADVTRTFNVTASGPQTFFGTTASGDHFAANLSADKTEATIIGYIAATKEAYVCTFTPNLDGTFNAAANVYTSSDSITRNAESLSAGTTVKSPSIHKSTTTADTSTRTFQGQFANGTLTGTILELNVAFSGTAQPATGPTTPIAGYYIAPAVDTSTGTIYSVVGTQSTIYVLTVSQGVVAADQGTINSSGNFSVTTAQGTTIRGAVDPSTTTLNGTITFPDDTTQSFTGLNTATLSSGRLINVSSRGNAGTGTNTLIAGFVISGPNSKTVLLRAVGPALAPFGISGYLSDPGLRLYDGSGNMIQSANSWAGAPELQDAFNRLGLFPFAPNSADSAMLVTLAPGAYTMHVVSASGGSTGGVALAEVYDASANPETEPQKLINISTRGNVGTGENVLIGGFVVSGNTAKRVLIRAAGPALTKYGVTGVLGDPTLTVYDSSNHVIAMNDNWGTPVTTGTQTPATAADVIAAETATGAFAFDTASKDSAVVLTLAPGAYTAIVSGANNTSGVGLVEIYEISP